MAGIYVQKNSPYYWIRYYDAFEPDPKKKRKSRNTKIVISTADQRRINSAKSRNDKEKLQGTPELRKLVREFTTGLNERDIQLKSGFRLVKKLKLSEGYEEFKKVRSVPGSKKFLKPKTLENYTIAVEHFKNCSGDKLIHKYTESNYVDLLYFFEEKKLSINSRSIYTRSLHSLWNYFKEQAYARLNIIESIEPEETDPDPIPLDDMHTIISYFKKEKRYPHHYWIVYFMLLTGCRPSSAIMQEKSDIDFKRKIITIRNVKTGEKKKKNFYRFPLYSELENLIKEMGVKQGDSGRLFHMYAVVPENYTWPLSFWKRHMKFLKKGKVIEAEYNMKQIRPTLANFLINVMRMDIFSVKKLLDHTDIKITDKHYINFNVGKTRISMADFTLDQLLSEA